MGDVILTMKDIDKSFPGVHALDHVNFEVRRGEVHALMGENGAGKSTLMKVLTGIYQKDSGSITYKGQEVAFHNTREAQDAGIVIVHQELNMVGDLTVAQNIFIGREPKKGIRVDDKKMIEDSKKLFQDLNIEIDPREKMSNLTVGKQQMCEIAKAISHKAEVIIFDEPSAALTEKEIADLFVIIRDLREKNYGIVYISHRMDEIKMITDRVTVMRDGGYEVDSFSIKYIPDNDAKILAMKNGEVDFLSGIKNVSAESYAQMEQTDGYGAQVDEKSLQTYYVGYNLSSEIFGDQVVREAISSAIDKDAVVDNIYGGLFDKADTFFSRDLPYCDVEQTVYGFDLDHANQILDEAGYVDTDGDGIREKDGVKLSAAFLYQTGTASDDNMVVYICDQASKIGIELTPQSAQMMDWYAMIQSGDYGLTIFKTQGAVHFAAYLRRNA